MPRKSGGGGGGGGAAIFRTGEAKVSKLPPTSHFWSNYPSNKIKHAGKESPESLEEKEVIWSDFIIVVYLAYFFFLLKVSNFRRWTLDTWSSSFYLGYRFSKMHLNFSFLRKEIIKFIYSEKATKFCEISTLLLSYVLK